MYSFNFQEQYVIDEQVRLLILLLHQLYVLVFVMVGYFEAPFLWLEFDFLCALLFLSVAEALPTFPALTGILALAYFIHNCIVSIMRNQRNPENNVCASVCLPLSVCLCLPICVCLSMCFCLYLSDCFCLCVYLSVWPLPSSLPACSRLSSYVLLQFITGIYLHFVTRTWLISITFTQYFNSIY